MLISPALIRSFHEDGINIDICDEGVNGTMRRDPLLYIFVVVMRFFHLLFSLISQRWIQTNERQKMQSLGIVSECE